MIEKKVKFNYKEKKHWLLLGITLLFIGIVAKFLLAVGFMILGIIALHFFYNRKKNKEHVKNE